MTTPNQRTAERGSTIVETGLLLLPLLLVLLGAMEGARYMFTYSQMAFAARDGARYASQHYEEVSNGADSTVKAAASKSIQDSLANAMTCTLTKTHTINPYVDLSCRTVFSPVLSIVPFSGTINVTSRMYAH